MLAVDFDEDLIDVEGITIASVLSLQSTGINGTEFYTPEADCFATDGDSAFSEKVFDVTVGQVETIVEPDSIGNDIWRETVAFISNDLPLP